MDWGANDALLTSALVGAPWQVLQGGGHRALAMHTADLLECIPIYLPASKPWVGNAMPPLSLSFQGPQLRLVRRPLLCPLPSLPLRLPPKQVSELQSR